MEAEFTRTGGIVGPAGEVRGRVAVSEGAGTVGGPDGDHARPLSPEEAAMFDPTALNAAAKAARDLKPKPHPGADLYQFDFHAKIDGGMPVRLHWRGEGGARPHQSDPAAALMNWVERECDRLWRDRAQALGGKRP